MYAVLGEPLGPIFGFFETACRQREGTVVSLTDFGPGIRFSWEFDSTSTCSNLVLRNGVPFSDREIKGVLVQKPPMLEAGASVTRQAERLQAEMNAILFAWFWSLGCPVINRYPASFWFAPGTPLAYWEPLIVRCGLTLCDSMLSNDEPELRRFFSDHQSNVRYAPFCDSNTYRVASEDDWAGLNSMRVTCPVHLISFLPPVYRACVVGQRVFWNRTVSDTAVHGEDQLKRLAALAGLDFLEVRLSADSDHLRVHAVEPFPNLAGFTEDSLTQIAEALVDLFQSLKPPIPQTAGSCPL